MELQENTAVAAAIESMAQVSEASAELAATSNKLPAELRAELDGFMESFSAEQSKIQATLKELDTTVAGIDGALVDVEKVVVSTDETARSLTTMAEAYSGLVDGVAAFMLQVDPPADPEDPPPPEPAEGAEQAPPFDIADYGSAAEKLTDTANGLTELVTQLQALTESDRSEVLIGNTEELFGSLMDQLLLKGAGLALLVGLIALGYRVAAKRLA